MTQYIKKVGVTPVRGNGFIVDSFHTNDNKKFNAPSIGAVEDRADKNLLFASSFTAFATSGYKVNGWSIEENGHYTGDTPAAFLPITGLMIPVGYSGTLTSPRFMPTNSYRSVYGDRSFSLTILFRVGVMPDMTSDPIVGKIENIVNENTYVEIFDGAWPDQMPYGTVHRLASKYRGKGIGRFCLDWAKERFGTLRADTHESNIPMQRALDGAGFTRCGVVYMDDGSPRVAFHWKRG